jgi:hypothetical protein
MIAGPEEQRSVRRAKMHETSPSPHDPGVRHVWTDWAPALELARGAARLRVVYPGRFDFVNACQRRAKI